MLPSDLPVLDIIMLEDCAIHQKKKECLETRNNPIGKWYAWRHSLILAY